MEYYFTYILYRHSITMLEVLKQYQYNINVRFFLLLMKAYFECITCFSFFREVWATTKSTSNCFLQSFSSASRPSRNVSLS